MQDRERIDSRSRQEETASVFDGFDNVVFGTVRFQILNMDLFPPINKAYVLITLEEHHKSII